MVRFQLCRDNHANAPLADIIQENARAELCSSNYMELHNLECVYHRGVLSLHGSVSRYFLSQLAESLVSGLAGVEAVENCLTVRNASRVATLVG